MESASLRRPCTYDIFLEAATGRLWQLVNKTDFDSGSRWAVLRDIKTFDIRSATDLDMTGIDCEGFKFVGNFPNYDAETLELLYGQRKSTWNY